MRSSSSGQQPEAAPGTEITVDLNEKSVVSGELRFGFDIDDYTRWRLLRGARRHRPHAAARSTQSPSSRRRPSWMPKRSQRRIGRLTPLGHRVDNRRLLFARRRIRGHDHRRHSMCAEASPLSGASSEGRQEPRHQGDGRSTARPDAQRAAQRARDQRCADRPQPARGLRRRRRERRRHAAA